MRNFPATRLVNPDALGTVVFLLVVPTVAHVLFSWMGFNPTDDGFTLAYSRRIIEGQVPHGDFIIIRPFVSPLLHVPFVLWGGAYTFWVSRWFVWFQLALISVLWVSIINRLLDNPFRAATKPLVALICFAACAHSFPIMAWHTIDGLMFISLGLWLVIRGGELRKTIGYVLIGVACLCKQNFILMAPAALVLWGDWRKARYWAASALPGAAYICFVLIKGVLPDAFLQLTTQTDLFSTGLIRYVRKWTPVAALVGYGAVHILLARAGPRSILKNTTARYWLGMAGLYGLPLAGTAASLARGYFFKSSFILFGILAGTLAYSWLWSVAALNARRAVWLALAAAWCASISAGYNSPVLLAGPLLVLMLGADRIVPRLPDAWPRRPLFVSTAAALIVLGFGLGRDTHIYREQPAGNLTQPLDGLLPGGRHIKTNPNTGEYLADLNQMIDTVRQHGRRFTILPGVAGYWVKSPQVNPLPIDWVQETELNRRDLVNRVIAALEGQRGQIGVIVQNIHLEKLATNFSFVSDSAHHEVVQHVRERFTKIAESRYHKLYE